MNELYTWNYEGNPIRQITILGEPWFAAEDVAVILGISDVREALVDPLFDKDKIDWPVICDPTGNESHPLFISKFAVYGLIYHANDAYAERFENWLKENVYPVIYKRAIRERPRTIDDLLCSPEQLFAFLSGLFKPQDTTESPQ